MTNQRNLRILFTTPIVCLFSFVLLSSWEFKETYHFWNDDEPENCDTIPKKDGREKKIRDFDDVLDELNNIDLKVDIEKIQKEVKESLNKLDADKIKMDMQKSLQEIDMEKIRKDVESSIAKIDWEKINAEMAKVKDVDLKKMQIELEKMQSKLAEMPKVDMKKIELDMEKMKKDLSDIGPEIQKSMEKAKVDIENAKVEIKEYKDFVDGLDKDGKLNKKGSYTIKHKDGELFINGKKADDATYSKYRSFLEKYKSFKIEKSDDDFNIRRD